MPESLSALPEPGDFPWAHRGKHPDHCWCLGKRGAHQRALGLLVDYMEGVTLGNILTGNSSEEKQIGSECRCRQILILVPGQAGAPGQECPSTSPGPLSLQFSKDVLRHPGMWQPEARNRSQWFLVILKRPGFVSLSKQRNEWKRGKKLFQRQL